MSYMLLIVEPADQRASRSLEAGQALFERMVAFADELRQEGVLAASQALASHGEAVRVRRRAGATQVVDGPFAEVKELIGGFYLLDGVTREQAVAIAERCPAAEWCTVEVRRVAPCYE